MVERIILGIAAVLVGLLIIFAITNAPPQGGSGPADSGVDISKYDAGLPADEWFRENVVNQPGAVIVDFKAEWCGPCRMLHPHLVEFETKYSDRVTLVQIDVDEQRKLARHFKIEAMPTVLLFVDGKVVSGFLGLRELDEIEALFKPVIDDLNSTEKTS